MTVALPEGESPAGRPAVIGDDVISSRVTALFRAPRGAARFAEEGVGVAVSCDGVPHASNGLSLAPLIVEALNGA